MDIEPAKKAYGLEIITYKDLLLGFKKPVNPLFTNDELKVEFHRRVKNRLYQHCIRFCQKNRLDDSTAKDVFQETIIKGLINISNFKYEDSWCEEKLKNKVAAWLNTIAYNLFIDLLKERCKCEELDENYFEIQDEDFRPDDFEFYQDDTTHLKLQDALDSLNENERFVINIYNKYNCLENNNHLPDDVIADICNTLSKSKVHIRVIKLRALKKMRLILKKK